MVSSVLTASISRCCKATKQSAQFTTDTMTGGGAISRIRRNDVVPLATQTRLPDRSDTFVIGESRGARMRWLASR
ncbi:Uncharacterised protein [Mycobacterium tuberculosis]|uniref:Uncharacterized protein n=1 Tax=Mycobacterium tuberculosis TaxID=1773 RepID=A0A655ET29_MYCTX|nr:Uncharacterised protein [Mycobacterium tuberculosis]COX45331.1 Uncharacterised protein [Mycobacterium tuberculosis]